MYISKRNASYIVQEISKIIGEKINMMNADGIIIASSDPDRIGSLHAAAKELVEQKLQEVIVNSDSQYEGARPGLNLAVNFQEEIVGVIGITGPYQEVAKYGQIIKKLTEILILDQYYKEQRDLDKRIKERFLDEWILGAPKNITPQFVKRGTSMQIDIMVPRRVMAITFMLTQKMDAANEQRVLDAAEKATKSILQQDKNNLLFRSGTDLICVVTDCPDSSMVKLAEDIKQEVEGKHPLKLCGGIDAGCEGYTNIHNSAVKALKAMKTSLRSPQKGVRLYSSLSMEIFQSELPSNIKQEFINRIFKDCSPEEVEQWIGLLNTFYEEEGSITDTAHRLYIHKNTLQYKLNKIKERTGYDPRSIRYSSLFYNAIHFYQDLHEARMY
ncbi:CdaR family transcriptional regulator [Acetanaerobacterium elongatum]|uniref:Carbohydrate diacid regulator n=1 Tax=Acetanaerobacterium elongatum TaxID=258515 RepID=A0A1G9U8K9_9FIRM|nr:sugar diacid recognition domain-containing protein [Acetanaerobacterium elongatum]SDM56143.1 carbohydrate diacid regulator [Acetanaerobacterium elongatum]